MKRGITLRAPAAADGDVDKSTDDTVGYDVAPRKVTKPINTVSAATPIKKGVPESVKAKTKTKPKARNTPSPAVSRVARRSPPLTARVPPSTLPTSTAHRVPYSSRVRSLTPGHTAHEQQTTRRRSLTPGTVRSLSAGGRAAPANGAAWEEIVSQQRSRHDPRESSDSARFHTELRNDQSPRSANTQPHPSASPLRAPFEATATLTNRRRKGSTPSPSASKRGKVASRAAAHKAEAGAPSWGRLLGAIGDDAPRTASPVPRRALTMTQAHPVKRNGPSFVTSLPLPHRAARHPFTVVFDLDQTLVNAHNADDTVVPRPGMLETLEAIGHANAERVMWTASNEAQAKFVLRAIPGFAAHFDYVVTWDTKGWGDRRDYVKDILKLARHSSSTLIVDNDHVVLRPHVHSGLVVPDYGDLQGGDIPDTCDVMDRLRRFVQGMSRMRPDIDVPSFVRTHGDWLSIRKKIGFYRLPTNANMPKEDGSSTARTSSPNRTPQAQMSKRPGNLTQTFLSPSSLPTSRSKTSVSFQRTSTSVKKRPTSPTRLGYH